MIATAATKKHWTILELLNWGTTYLTEKGIDEARLTIELLLAHVLKLQRIQLYTSFDKPLSDEELARFKELLKRRLTNEPLQYILGEAEFMGLKFAVDKRVLIPRPDTEILVETALTKIKTNFSGESEIRILDIGTGSGCIAVSLAKMVPNAKIVSIDASAEALEVAMINAETNSVNDKITFVTKDFLAENNFTEQFHCIVSNPPYISNEEYAQLSSEVKNFEPRIALLDDGDGLKFFHAIAQRSKTMLLKNGFVAVEHAYNQTDDVQKIFSDNGWKNIQAVKDYGGMFRCVIAERGEP